MKSVEVISLLIVLTLLVALASMGLTGFLSLDPLPSCTVPITP